VGSAPMNGQTDKQTVVKTVHAATSAGVKMGFIISACVEIPHKVW